MAKRSCDVAMDRLAAAVREAEASAGRQWIGTIVGKVNQLAGMRYLKQEDERRFDSDYDFLRQQVRDLSR